MLLLECDDSRSFPSLYFRYPSFAVPLSLAIWWSFVSFVGGSCIPTALVAFVQLLAIATHSSLPSPSRRELQRNAEDRQRQRATE